MHLTNFKWVVGCVYAYVYAFIVTNVWIKPLRLIIYNPCYIKYYMILPFNKILLMPTIERYNNLIIKAILYLLHALFSIESKSPYIS